MLTICTKPDLIENMQLCKPYRPMHAMCPLSFIIYRICISWAWVYSFERKKNEYQLGLKLQLSQELGVTTFPLSL